MSEVNLADYNRAGYLAFMFSMAATMAFFVYIAFIHPGVNLDEISVDKKEAVVETQAPPAEQAQPAQ
ncbi:MAG: hypothetical protein H6623_02925 [Bdellovibrionaceae bacterium]|nr:hypothetical protein [Pseudobdellovibrionaceae bacterium]